MTTINSLFAKSAAATVSNNNTTSAETDVMPKDQVVIYGTVTTHNNTETACQQKETEAVDFSPTG